MRLNKWFVFLILFTSIIGCIKRFDPDLNNESNTKYVVQGMVSSIEGWQNVSVSRTSLVTNPEYIPVNDCVVKIIDDTGNSFLLDNYDAGEYHVWMNETDLVEGRAFKVLVITPNGETLESTFDQMPTGPQVEDVFFEITDIPSNSTNELIHGIQFYTNLIADNSESRYYRWKLTETWEYHAQYPKEWYYDGQLHEHHPAIYTEKICWRTLPIEKIFTLSTSSQSGNSFLDFPLNFVDNTTSRLAILYSLHIQQIALSEEAFNYWDDLRINSSQDGGLYTSQPLAVKGNITNLTDSDAEVLGFFQASKIETKRIFVEPQAGLDLDFSNGCTPQFLEFGFSEISPSDYPAYLLTINNVFTMNLLDDACVDCTALGGTTEKPDFWPL